MTEGKLSRQSTHEANLRKAGWRRVGVWFSPEDLARLSGLAVGGSEQEAVRRAVRLASEYQPQSGAIDYDALCAGVNARYPTIIKRLAE